MERSKRPDRATVARLEEKPWARYLRAASGSELEIGSLRPVGTVELLIDCSGSMQGGKLDSARKGAAEFASDALGKGYAVGVVSIATVAARLSPACRLAKGIHCQIEGLMAQGSTDLAGALGLAYESLAQIRAERVVCIVTDGFPDDREAALTAALRLKRAGVDVMVIGTDDADLLFLREISSRDSLAVRVAPERLQLGIAAMARFLPAGEAGVEP